LGIPHITATSALARRVCKDEFPSQEQGIGLIAQEVERVVPEVVHTADDEMQTKSVEYQYLVGLLVEAIKEQQKQYEQEKNLYRVRM